MIYHYNEKTDQLEPFGVLGANFYHLANVPKEIRDDAEERFNDDNEEERTD